MRIGEDPRLSDRRVTEWFLLEKARREKRPDALPAEPGVHAVITISREYGSGGRSVALALANILGSTWQVWDREIIESVAQAAQVRGSMIEALDERTQGWMDQIVRSMLNVRVMDPGAYRKNLAQVLLALAQQGRKIIVGRGGNFVLPDALNVRLRAKLDHRIHTTMERENLTRDDALRQINRVDAERAEFTRRIFGREANDVTAYDMVVATDELTIEATAAAIAAAARVLFGSAM